MLRQEIRYKFSKQVHHHENLQVGAIKHKIIKLDLKLKICSKLTKNFLSFRNTPTAWPGEAK